MHSHKEFWAHGFAALYLITLLVVPGASTGMPALACLAAIAAGSHGWCAEARSSFRHMSLFVVPAAIFLLHIAVQLAIGMAPSRFSTHLLIGLLTLWVGLSGIPSRMPDVRQWLLPAACLGAILSALFAVYQVVDLGYLRPYGWIGAAERANGAIKYGNLSAVQALLSLVLVLTANRRDQRLLGLAGLFCGVLSLALTQTRGGMLGFAAAVAVLGVAMSMRGRNRENGVGSRGGLEAAGGGSVLRAAPALVARRRLRLGGMIVLTIVLTASAAGFMHDRFADIQPQVERYLNGDADSELGQRLALWHAAARAAVHAPLTGSGFGGFAQEIQRQVDSGDIPKSMPMHYAQTHNEYLAALVDAGITGFLAFLAMAMAPIVGLVRQIRGGNNLPACYAGLVIATAFAVFALTDNIFDRQIMVIAYYFLITWFLRAAYAPQMKSD